MGRNDKIRNEKLAKDLVSLEIELMNKMEEYQRVGQKLSQLKAEIDELELLIANLRKS